MSNSTSSTNQAYQGWNKASPIYKYLVVPAKALYRFQQKHSKQIAEAANLSADVYAGDYLSAASRLVFWPRPNRTYTRTYRTRKSGYSSRRRYRQTRTYRRSFKRSYRSYKRYSRYQDRRRKSYARGGRRRYTRRRYRRYNNRGYRSYTGRGRFADSGSARHNFHFNHTGKPGHRYHANADTWGGEPYPGAIYSTPQQAYT